MSFFKNMELPEVLIIVSLTALPFVGWWISVEVDAIDKARRAVSANTRAGGNIESVGELQEQIELVEDNRRTTGADAQNPGTYFELQLTESDSARRLQADDYKISNQKPRPGQIGKGREKQLVTDYEVDITFQKKGDKKDYTMNREFLFAMLLFLFAS